MPSITKARLEQLETIERDWGRIRDEVSVERERFKTTLGKVANTARGLSLLEQVGGVNRGMYASDFPARCEHTAPSAEEVRHAEELAAQDRIVVLESRLASTAAVADFPRSQLP